MKKNIYYKKIFLSFLISTTLACGMGDSSGGVEDSTTETTDSTTAAATEETEQEVESNGNPARLDLRVDPNILDAGDFITTEINISEISKPFILKIRYNNSLKYLKHSMTVYIGNTNYILPTKPRSYKSANNTNYLVEIFPDIAVFEQEKKARVVINFQAIAELDDNIAVDADEYLAHLSNSEFDPDNPLFSPIKLVSVEVANDAVATDDTETEE
jgi:hypothetical protein